MASIRQIRRRIKSVKSTKQITRAVQMVAAARLKKLQGRLISSRPYARKMDELLNQLASATGQIENPLFEKREVKSIGLVIVAGDRGLCGSYNVNAIRKAEEYIKQFPKGKVQLMIVGKKAYDYFRRRNHPILYHFSHLHGKLDLAEIQVIARTITNEYLTGKVDEIQLLYTNFISPMRYQPTITRFLPIVQKAEVKSDKKSAKSELNYIFEPNAKQIFELLLPRYLTTKIYISMAESFTSEQNAQMIAMQNATDAATDMIDSLTLLGNKLRQAQITKEIAEIVGGAEALVT